MAATSGLSIGEVVARTGVAGGTLRMWERRHGFPSPARVSGRHRRYSERDVELIARVAAERAAGVSLAAAIERAVAASEPPVSVFAALRRRRADIEPRRLPKRLMIALSHAIEEESLSRAERPLLFASFQRARFYEPERTRWRVLARGADLAAVFADFDRLRVPVGGPIEVPVERSDPMSREWAVVCDAPHHAVCLAGWEPPDTGPERVFEAVWTVEPEVVRGAARICAGMVARVRPELVEPARTRLDSAAGPPAAEQLRLATAITNRTLSMLA